ncbi:hypothetical protein [Rhodococcus tukisamuensis]|uniref:Uncharacterized protein n=1 Tax=Rhodococcus tukisamuensis TaxID=168276 RepID=A0A1G6WGN0_9NOCA|nr:hypothetical protein [Rhodococcus tukisamuensis]SDD64236.1 hypothetical protein SAMN05444580_105341 [Rhodococcus tukisamuensis]
MLDDLRRRLEHTRRPDFEEPELTAGDIRAFVAGLSGVEFAADLT